MNSLSKYKQELQEKYDELVKIKDHYDANLQRISEIYNEMPTDNSKLLSELSTIEGINNSYRDRLSELPIVKAELEEIELQQLSDKRKYEIYEEHKKRLKFKDLTDKQYEQEIKHIKQMLDL